MLTIRAEQMKAIEEAALRAFEDEMVRHLGQFVPRLAEVLGEPSLRQAVRLGIERARGHGLTNRGPIRLYIELMVLFGGEFDTDPLLPWATEALTDATDSGQMARAERLYGRSLAYLDRVGGPEDSYAIEALRRFHRARIEDYPAARRDFEEVALRGLSDIYPQKCEYVGEPALRALIRRGLELARRYSVAADPGVALFIALPLDLGHGFATDPLLPWIAGALHDPRVSDPAKRAERLYSRTKTYLSEALAQLER